MKLIVDDESWIYSYPEGYLELSQMFKMILFAKIVNDLRSLKNFILDA